MATATFSALPAEIHVSIAEHCDTGDLYNLCLTSKRMNKTCFCLLYRAVDLQLDPDDDALIKQDYPNMIEARNRQQQFVHTLRSRPEYGKHVRFLKTRLYVPMLDESLEDMYSEKDFWCTLRLLTHVQSVEVASKYVHAHYMPVPTRHLPKDLFQSATSIKLEGQMQYGMAKSILHAINPANLKYLCLDKVQDYNVEKFQSDFYPGERAEDGRIIALGATSGLLTPLVGRCTALQTLILRRIGEYHPSHLQGWHPAAEEASYLEWASFIGSVKGTLEEFTFEQVGESLRHMTFDNEGRRFRTMDERFLQLILPAIVAGNWPCLTMIELQGVRTLNGEVGEIALEMGLRAVVGENTKIVMNEQAHYYDEVFWERILPWGTSNDFGHD